MKEATHQYDVILSQTIKSRRQEPTVNRGYASICSTTEALVFEY